MRESILFGSTRTSPKSMRMVQSSTDTGKYALQFYNGESISSTTEYIYSNTSIGTSKGTFGSSYLNIYEFSIIGGEFDYYDDSGKKLFRSYESGFELNYF